MENFFTIGILLKTIDRASRPIYGVSRSLSHLSSQTDRTLSRLNLLADKLKAVGTSLENLGNTLIGLGAFKAITGAFSELEDASALLKSTFMESGGKIPEVFEKINEEAKILGTELPGTAADFYRLAASMKALGIEGKVLAEGGLRAAAYLAVSLRIPYEQAGISVAKFAQALRIQGEELIKFIDVVQRLGHLGVETTQMAYAFGKLSGTLRLAGWGGLETAKKLAPLVGRLIQLGHSGETVGTNLANMFDAMMKAEKVKKVNEILRNYGVQLQFIDEQTGKLKSPELIVAELSKIGLLIKKGLMARSEALALFTQLFGEGAAAEFAITFAIEGVEGYNKMVEALQKQASLQERVKVATSTLRAAWDAFTGTIQNVLAAIGTAMAPSLKSLLTMLNNVAGWLEEFFLEHRTIAAVFAWGVAGATAFSAALLALGTAISLMSVPLKGLNLILKILSLSLNLFRLRLFLARLALVAFINAHIITTKLSDLRMAILSLAEAFGTSLTKSIYLARLKLMALSALSKLRGVFYALALGVKVFSRALLTTPIGLAATAIVAAGALIVKNWDSVRKALEKVKAFIQGFVGRIISLNQRLLSSIPTFLASLRPLHFVANTIKRSWEGLLNLWSSIKARLSTLITSLSRNWASLLQIFLKTNPITAPVMALKHLASYIRSVNFFEAGQKIILSLWEGIKSMASKPVEAIKNIAQKMRNYLPFSPAKEGPLRDIHRTGYKLIETISMSISPTPIKKALEKALSVIPSLLPPIPALNLSILPTLEPFFFRIPVIEPPIKFPSPLQVIKREEKVELVSRGADMVTGGNQIINVYLGGITINAPSSEPRDLAENITAHLEDRIRRVLEKIAKDKWRRAL